jgi:uncharacterized membrane protein YvbJ
MATIFCRCCAHRATDRVKNCVKCGSTIIENRRKEILGAVFIFFGVTLMALIGWVL